VSDTEPVSSLTVERRRAIFKAVVEAQDGGQPVVASRSAVAARYEVTDEQVKDIELEGLEHGWPTL
jgi:hypothetical protein